MKALKTHLKKAFLTLFLIGLSPFCHGIQEPKNIIKEQNYRLIVEAVKLIEDYYVDTTISTEKLVNSAIKGMFSSLDPYSRFYANQEEIDNSDISIIQDGYYCGIGITIMPLEDNNATIASVKKGSPAEKAGLEKGDILKKVDGIDLSTIPWRDITKKILGKEGTKVDITVVKKNPAQEKTYSLKREKIDIEVIQSHMHDDICYINASTFNVNTAKHIRKEIQSYFSAGKKIEGIIFDLRGNGGGSIDSAREVASYFLDSGVLAKVKSRTNPSIIYIDKDVAKAPKVPLVVLIDNQSASASEMVAGAIKDAGRGILIGTKTFGKGVGQAYLPLRDKLCKLTTFEFLTPNGSTINKIGITPHIVVKTDGAVQKTDLNAENNAQNQYLVDKQYAKAIDSLSGYIKLAKLKT